MDNDMRIVETFVSKRFRLTDGHLELWSSFATKINVV